MGESRSWVAIRGLERAEVAARLDCADTDEPADRRAELALGQLSDGWLVIVCSRFDFVASRQLSELSKGAELAACQIEEHVMFSAAYGFRDGVQTWSVAHDPDKGLYNLEIEGTPPPELDAIRAQLRSQQDAEGGEEADVDFIFEAASDLVAALSGYRHNYDDAVALTWLRPLRTRPRPIRRGFLQSLFGRRPA
jgi:hypothetical protein